MIDTILDCTKTNKEKSKTVLSKGNQAIMLFEVASHLSMEDETKQMR
jgi:hypothetical protein